MKRTPFRFRRERKTARQKTWERKRYEKDANDEWWMVEEGNRASARANVRRNASLARGLANYRNLLGLKKAEFSELFEIDRRTLYNYETGISPVPGDLIEKIVKRGDCALNEIFATEQEPDFEADQKRYEAAEISLNIFLECFRQGLPSSWRKRATEFALTTLLESPVREKASLKNVEQIADRLMEEYRYCVHIEEMAELDTQAKADLGAAKARS